LFFKSKIPVKIILVVGLLATIVVIYWTYFRTDYLGLTLAIFSILLIYFYKKYGNKNKIYKLIIYTLPAINLAFTILLIFFIVFMHIHGNKAINSPNSLYNRLHEWQFMADKFILKGNIFNLFLGHGIIEYGYGKVPSWRPNIPALLHLKPSILLFDNTYLQIILYNGIISLVFFLALFIYIWKLLLKLLTVIPEKQFYFYAYVLTIFATLPAMFMFDNFNSLYNIYAVIPAFIVLIAYNKKITPSSL
jgi:O-antigen ligase